MNPHRRQPAQAAATQTAYARVLRPTPRPIRPTLAGRLRIALAEQARPVLRAALLPPPPTAEPDQTVVYFDHYHEMSISYDGPEITYDGPEITDDGAARIPAGPYLVEPTP